MPDRRQRRAWERRTLRRPHARSAPIYQDGDASNSHVPARERKAPCFLHTLRMVEWAYSQGADVGRMMAIGIFDVNMNNRWMCELDSMIYGAFAHL